MQMGYDFYVLVSDHATVNWFWPFIVKDHTKIITLFHEDWPSIQDHKYKWSNPLTSVLLQGLKGQVLKLDVASRKNSSRKNMH